MANGKVVDVVKGFPDVKPGVVDQDLTFKEAGGNHVILDIGGGRYAFYAHLKPGSIEVKEGDQVTRGQRIARLGNWGNTSAPHLHFHVMDAAVAARGGGQPALRLRLVRLSGLSRRSRWDPEPTGHPQASRR